jgi:hypothetical protein
MKLTIDTDRKVIEIDQAINLKDLIKGLKKLLGDDWEEYSIEQRITWNYYPWYPSYTLYTNVDDVIWVDGNKFTSALQHEN